MDKVKKPNKRVGFEMVVKQEMEKDNKKVIFWISEKKKRKRVRC